MMDVVQPLLKLVFDEIGRLCLLYRLLTGLVQLLLVLLDATFYLGLLILEGLYFLAVGISGDTYEQQNDERNKKRRFHPMLINKTTCEDPSTRPPG